MTVQIKTATLVRLRDALRESGRRPSLVMSSAYETLARAGILSPTEQAALARVEPLAEVMYLMMAADGRVAESERAVVRGAIRGLSDDAIRGGTVKVMLEKFEKDVLACGRTSRLDDLTESLRDDPPSAEGAFVLAAVVAFADERVTAEENALINELRERLGIAEDRANVLLDRLQED
jgi:tellurite resistance protein